MLYIETLINMNDRQIQFLIYLLEPLQQETTILIILINFNKTYYCNYNENLNPRLPVLSNGLIDLRL